MSNAVKHPCQSCVYFDQCGESTRTEPCSGRLTQREKNRIIKDEKTKNANRKYIIERTSYPLNEDNEPIVSKIDRGFCDKNATAKYVENLCQDMCERLNMNHESPCFRWEKDSSGHYDYTIHFWNGNNYQVVTGYKIY